METIKTDQTNLGEFQEMKRQEMQGNVDAAIHHLRELGVRVTKRAIAEEVGCHENTLRKPYLKEFLSRYEEFQPKGASASKAMTLEEALRRIAQLEDERDHSRHNNRKLRDDLAKVRKERDDFELKYRKLLWQYQVDVGNRKTKL